MEGTHDAGDIPVGPIYRDYFLQYASYVITDRAIPDIEDGMKPVQRRLMHTLSVMDDGSGFEFSDLDRLEIATVTASGFGLFSIRERVRSVDGAMVIETSPGQGTSVHLDFPMPEETAAGSGG